MSESSGALGLLVVTGDQSFGRAVADALERGNEDIQRCRLCVRGGTAPGGGHRGPSALAQE